MSFAAPLRTKTTSTRSLLRVATSALNFPIAAPGRSGVSSSSSSSSRSNLHSRPILAQRAFSSSARAMGVHNLQSKSDFDTAIGEPDKIVVLDCFATWCGPCKVIAPQVVKFSEKFPTAGFYKLDVDEVPEVAQLLGIRAMPTFLLFKNSEKISEVVGANPKALESAIETAIQSTQSPQSTKSPQSPKVATAGDGAAADGKTDL